MRSEMVLPGCSHFGTILISSYPPGWHFEAASGAMRVILEDYRIHFGSIWGPPGSNLNVLGVCWW